MLVGFRLLGAALFIAIGLLSVNLAVEDAATADVQLMARRIEQAGPISLRALATVVDDYGRSLAEQSCRSKVQRAAITVHLAYLQQQDASVDYSSWSRASTVAEAATRHALGRMPAEGNACVRHAMVQQQIAERPEDLSALLNMSAKLSPADSAPLVARLALWQRMSERSRALSRVVAADGLAVFLNRARLQDIRRLLQSSSVDLKDLASDTLSGLPDTRQAQVRLLLPGSD